MDPRRWFGHVPPRLADLRRRYAEELAAEETKLRELLRRARSGALTRVYGGRDTEHDDAVVLAEVLLGETRQSREPGYSGAG